MERGTRHYINSREREFGIGSDGFGLVWCIPSISVWCGATGLAGKEFVVVVADDDDDVVFVVCLFLLCLYVSIHKQRSIHSLSLLFSLSLSPYFNSLYHHSHNSREREKEKLEWNDEYYTY